MLPPQSDQWERVLANARQRELGAAPRRRQSRQEGLRGRSPSEEGFRFRRFGMHDSNKA